MSWLALDVGGANLKAADGLGWAHSEPFALWQNPTGLAGALSALLDTAPPSQLVAITMTGELCDCFATKADGVRHILAAAETAVRGRALRVYLVNGRLVGSDEARERPQLAAASNWHALASYVATDIGNGAGVLIDIGSTTTDVVPFADGRPRATGLTDTERLLANELVYAGVGRTPVCAVTSTLPWRGRLCPVAAELFATTADAYLVLGELVERPDAKSAADARPMIRRYAQDRLARMICLDPAEFGEGDAIAAATAIRDAQVERLRRALAEVVEHLPKPPTCIVLSGLGEFLGTRVADVLGDRVRQIMLSHILTPLASVAAPAHALAVLARRTCEALPAEVRP